MLTTCSVGITVVKSMFQIFGDAACDLVLPLLEKLIADKADRHKQRAAGELLGGAPLLPQTTCEGTDDVL